MAAPLQTPRSEWITEGLRALAQGGPSAVRIDALAKSLGVTRGGFYWHFADRQALLEEMLESWEQTVIDAVIETVDRGGGDGKARLQRLFDLALTLAGAAPLAVEPAIRDWARNDQTVAEHLRRVDNRRMEYMRGLFRDFCADEADVEARCTLVMTLFIGSAFLIADHGGRRRSDVIERAVQLILG